MASGKIANGNIKLLWTNTSPLTSFVAQTISLEPNDCDFFIVQFNYADVVDGVSVIIKVGEAGMAVMAVTTGWDTGVFNGGYFRRITASTQNSITFGTNYYASMTANAAANNGLIPHYVFGFKL